MDILNNYSKAKEILDKAKEVLIVISQNPSADSIGSGLSLYLGLLSLNKKVIIACANQITVGLSQYVGVNKITSSIARKNFIISLDYQEGSIEKVSYNIEGNKFNLVIEPKPDSTPFTEKNIHYSYSGASADVIITINSSNLESLGQIYNNDRQLFSKVPVINIDSREKNSQFGQVNIVRTNFASTVEIVYGLLSALEIKISADIASNLLNALYVATNNFHHPLVNDATFKLAAECIVYGANRTAVAAPVPISPETSIESPPTRPEKANVQVVPPSQNISVNPNQTVSTNQNLNQNNPVTEKTAPAEWLRPKIYKTSSH